MATLYFTHNRMIDRLNSAMVMHHNGDAFFTHNRMIDRLYWSMVIHYNGGVFL